MAYIPSLRVLKEGGYEGAGRCSTTGCLRPGPSRSRTTSSGRSARCSSTRPGPLIVEPRRASRSSRSPTTIATTQYAPNAATNAQNVAGWNARNRPPAIGDGGRRAGPRPSRSRRGRSPPRARGRHPCGGTTRPPCRRRPGAKRPPMTLNVGRCGRRGPSRSSARRGRSRRGSTSSARAPASAAEPLAEDIRGEDGRGQPRRRRSSASRSRPRRRSRRSARRGTWPRALVLKVRSRWPKDRSRGRGGM